MSEAKGMDDARQAARAGARSEPVAVMEPGSSPAGAPREPDAPLEPMYDLLELLFLAYRDFVGDADRLLLRYDFGRAHHRVLHFVDRRPGMAVAELLDLLKITKQSLSRVLKDLLDQRYLEQRPGVTDRRQRLMFPTEKGRVLAHELATLQTRRLANALAQLRGGSREDVAAFLAAMCDPQKGDPQKGDPQGGDPRRGDSAKASP
jgi:DNA-binding MarR family transcriptional regulator